MSPNSKALKNHPTLCISKKSYCKFSWRDSNNYQWIGLQWQFSKNHQLHHKLSIVIHLEGDNVSYSYDLIYKDIHKLNHSRLKLQSNFVTTNQTVFLLIYTNAQNRSWPLNKYMPIARCLHHKRQPSAKVDKKFGWDAIKKTKLQSCLFLGIPMLSSKEKCTSFQLHTKLSRFKDQLIFLHEILIKLMTKENTPRLATAWLVAISL